ncbi:hypothetical protein Amal_03713 [Acetobacter malorum]|uniref:Uncharacterized protein n=1 Tax=Acetobacter malorum TaxID=178901 RepID=A0A177G6G5_9PROT|nr:hypothetical protein Amal_03713 [Acetobacter malorum]
MDAPVMCGQIVDFQSGQKLFDCFRISQQGGNDNKSAHMVRNAVQ